MSEYFCCMMVKTTIYITRGHEVRNARHDELYTWCYFKQPKRVTKATACIIKALALTSKGRHAVIFFFSGWPGSLRLSPTLNFLAVRLASPTELSPLRFNTHTCKKNAGKLFKLETALAPTVSLHIPKTSSYLTSASPKNYKHYLLPTPPS